MQAIAFHDFLNLLPTGADLGVKKQPAGVALPTEGNPRFVEPDLIVERPIDLGSTAVVLLSAPGAVGKSTLASEVSARRRAPFWDLSKFQVGTGTFAGTILEVYDFNATGVLKRFREGRALLVLDALDEAQVRAGGQNFDAFLSELAEACREPRARPSLVLLARSDTADWIDIVLEEAGVRVARYKISYFDERRAEEFIDKLLDARRDNDRRQLLHRLHREPYTEARQQLFGLIYELFSVTSETAWNDPRVRNFLGYAPVLEALTGYLDVGNYTQLINELHESAGFSHDPWRFLAELMERIMERERGKFADALRPRLAPTASRIGWSDWSMLYAREEQCARVLSHTLGVASGSAARVPTEFPQPLAVQYDEALKIQLPQHPFLAGKDFANVVFKEYCYAWGLLEGPATIANPLRDAMRHREHPFLPSEVFGWFLTNLGGPDSLLDAQDFGLFYESLASRSKQPWMTVEEADQSLIHAQLDFGLDDDEVAINLITSGRGLCLWRSLHHAQIDVSCPIQLGLPEQRFVLGPAVDIRCGTLALLSDSIDVDVTEGVTMMAEAYSSLAPELKLRVRNEGRGNLAVSWPDVAHPWAMFRVNPASASARLIDSSRGDALRKFILMFYRQRRRKMTTLLAARWSPDQRDERDELLELAQRMGVLRAVPGDRHETVELTSDFHSLTALVQGQGTLSPKARQFVAQYLGPQEATRILAGT